MSAHPAVSAVKILDWRPMQKGALRGFAKIALPSGMIISDVTVLTAERGPWVSPPSKPMVGRDGIALRDDGGKMKYSPIIEFTSRERRDQFSAAVLAALAALHPDALA
jgi:DNA-binding cell septation regulator SpoVG